MLGPLKNAAMRLGIPRRAKFEGFLSHRLGQQLGGRVVVHPERLQHPGIRQEGARALAIEGAQLVHILQDGPELQPVSGHQPHGALRSEERRVGKEWVSTCRYRWPPYT